MGAQPQSWIMDIIRTLLSCLDSIVYGLINWILYGIFDLANLTTSSEILNGIYSRIYVILGVFMAFKLCFSFFGYILDPESMVGQKSDKSVPKLLMNAGLMLAALVVLPTILFNNGEGGGGLINRAQNAFLPMLPRILLGINDGTGMTVGSSSVDSSVDDAADVMAAATLQAFFSPPPLTPNVADDDLDDICGEGTTAEIPAITSIDDFIANVNLTCTQTGTGVIGIGATRYYLYSYTYVVSTIVGILMVFMLLAISIDIAKRVFKMIILQIIAPIPIMTLIDPKSKTKDGTFGHWLSSLISTFLDIFVKLGILYVILMMIQMIVSKEIFENFPSFTEQPLRGTYLTVFLILGLIFFAKEAPKFIKDSLGIKDNGAGMGVGMGAAAGALGGLIAGRGLSGALTGAVAGANADPKVGGYAAGRDLAGQIRTGDKNWKGGLLNNLSRNMTQRQGANMARSMGVTEDSVKQAKGYMNQLEQQVSDLTRDYEEAIRSTDQNVRATIGDRRQALEKAEKALSDAKSNYEKMNKVAEAYQVTGRTPQAEKLRNRSIVHRATTRVGNAVGGATRGIRNATVNVVENAPIIGGIARSIDSGVQQHHINQISRGEVFDHAVPTGTNAKGEPTYDGTTVSNTIENRRNDLDRQGTLQGHTIRRQNNNNNNNNNNGNNNP